MTKLIASGLGEPEREYVLAPGTTRIGRNPKSDITLADTQVSWAHAAITCAQDGCLIEDLGSTNGTFVGRRRIERALLQDGDSIRIGPYDLRVRMPPNGLSAETASEYTLFSAGPGHVHQIDGVKDPYATQLSAKLKHNLFRTGRTSGAARSKPPPPPPANAIAKRLPVLAWGPSYEKTLLAKDVVAGVSIAALLIPQGMAYALLAGIPPVMGLYASMLPMFVYALSGTGRQTSVGPVALDSIMVAIGVGALAHAGTEDYTALVILLAGLIGTIQIVMGLLRLGFLVNFLSYPVLSGFMAAAAVITAVSQLKHLFGIRIPPDHAGTPLLLALAARLPEANLPTAAIGVAGILLLVGLKRWLPRVPGPFSVLVAFTLIAGALGLERYGVSTVGSVLAGLPALRWPDIHWDDVTRLLPLALSMALIGFSQTISVGKSLGNKYGYDVDANQELTALGLSNVSACLTQGCPVSGGLSRSAVNADAGARTPVSAMVTAVLVTVAVLYLTPLVEHLPHAALSAIILVSAIGLIDVREMRYLFRIKKTEGLLLVFTFLATLTVGAVAGLLLGIIASILLFISLNTRPNTAVLGRLPGTNIFRNIDSFHEAETVPGLLILRIDASLYFANTEFLKSKVRDLLAGDDGSLRAIVLDASAVNDLDSSATTALHQITGDLKKHGIAFFIAGVKGPVREVMIRSGLYDLLGGDHFFFTIDAAVKRFQMARKSGAEQ